MRARIGLVVLALLAAAGCTTNAGGPAPGAAGVNDRGAATVGPSPTRWPAATAGGACQLMDFDVIASAVGTAFDVAAASQSGDTFTCVLEQTRTSLPDLALSVTPTQADPGIFKSTVVPKGAAAVANLGKAGYSAAVPAGAGAGPGVEIGWLSANQRLMSLRLRTAVGTAPADAAALTPKLVALAKTVDQTTV